MDRKILLGTGIIIIILIGIVGINAMYGDAKTTLPLEDETQKALKIKDGIGDGISNSSKKHFQIIDFSYIDSNSILKSSLASKGISMSSPLKLTGDSITKYCNFYKYNTTQNTIQYCTSTELKDSDNNFLGNIHMIGTTASPNAVFGIIQTDPQLSQLDSIKITYQIMVESLVCDCWQDHKPGKLESVSAWIDAAKSHHLDGDRMTSNSKISGFPEKKLFLEITTNAEGYLWKLIITD